MTQQKITPAGANGGEQHSSQKTTTDIVTHFDRDIRERATELLRYPQETTWDPQLADEMLRLTARSIGVRLNPWGATTLSVARACHSEDIQEMADAQQKVDSAYAKKDTKHLAAACGNWFRTCQTVWIVGGGRS